MCNNSFSHMSSHHLNSGSSLHVIAEQQWQFLILMRRSVMNLCVSFCHHEIVTLWFQYSVYDTLFWLLTRLYSTVRLGFKFHDLNERNTKLYCTQNFRVFNFRELHHPQNISMCENYQLYGIYTLLSYWYIVCFVSFLWGVYLLPPRGTPW